MLLEEVALSTTLQDITCGPSGPRRLWAGVPGGPNTVNPSLQVGKGDRFAGAVLVCTEAGRSAGLVQSIVAPSAALLLPLGV